MLVLEELGEDSYDIKISVEETGMTIVLKDPKTCEFSKELTLDSTQVLLLKAYLSNV
jgi:hypothetical protein